MKKFGFTMAEVLMTLTIIGIVAAITLPSLTHDMQKHALEKQTLKFYNQVQTFARMYLATNFDTGFNGEISEKIIRESFNIVDICESDDTNCSDIRSVKYKRLDGSDAWNPFGNTVYTLADGTIFHYKDYDQGYYGLRFYFDVNGKQGPNVNGYDLWQIIVLSDGSVRGLNDAYTDSVEEWLKKTPSELKTYYNNMYEECKKSTDGTYNKCFDHFVQNKFKFDY